MGTLSFGYNTRRPAQSDRWRFGFTLALTATALWSTLPIALKLLLDQMASPTIVWYRFLLAGLIMVAVLWSRGQLSDLPFRPRSTLVLFLGAAVGFSSNNLVFLLGLGFISPMAAQVVIQLAPLMLMLGGVVLFGERLSQQQRAGVAVLLLGILTFFQHRLKELVWSLGDYGIGILLIVVSAALWAGYALAQKQVNRLHSSIATMCGVYLVGTVIMSPLARPSQLQNLDAVGWGLLIYCVLNTVVGYGAFAEALAHWEASRVGGIVAIAPLLTAAASILGSRVFPGYSRPRIPTPPAWSAQDWSRWALR